MARYIAQWKFSTVIQHSGRNELVAAEDGQTLDLDDALALMVNTDTGGVLKKVTKAGTTKAKRSSTRQVGAASSRKK